MLDLNDKRVQLVGVFVRGIQMFTRHTPMVIEDIIDALCFTAGHALAQKAATKFTTAKRLRELAIAALDRGISEGSRDRTGGAQLVIPPTRN